MCFFNSPLGRYYSLHSVLIFIVLALIAAWWQHQPGDLLLSATYFESTKQTFLYATHSVVYPFGKYLIWLIPFGGAGVWLVWAVMQNTSAQRRLYAWVAFFFFSSPLLVGVIKQFTAMPRPMHLQQFGGELSMPSDFWASGFAQGGGALPSVHATCGFIFVAFYYIGWARQRPCLRWGGLAAAVVLGLGFGYLRIMQGYHSLSQVLWSAAVVWLYASLWFAPALKKAGMLSPCPRSL